jgi:hypothetical protein
MKDPAVLFYTSDFITGTLTMTDEQRGKYIILLCLQHQQGFLTEEDMLHICKSFDEKIFSKFDKDKLGYYYNERMLKESDRRNKYCESRRQSRKKSDEDNVRIYLIRDNVRGTYKIGSSVNPLRRYNELCNQQNPAIMGDVAGERDISLVWYSNPVKRIAETILHKHFINKLIAGEWYELNDEDLEYIYKKYEGRFYERTIARTENENININKDVNNILKELYKGVEIFFDEDCRPKTEKAKNEWYDTLDKLIRIDGYTPEHIHDVIKRARMDDFWRQNFLSILKLRKKNKDGIPYFTVFEKKLNNGTKKTIGADPYELAILEANKLGIQH